MRVWIRRTRASVSSRISNGDARPDNRLALADQFFFAGQDTTGQKEVVQVVWVYEHAIDFDGLKRFHHNLGYGLLGRRIERSPLPFGRHRGVLDRGPSDLEVAERARSRAELSDWADERAQLPVDAERGPGGGHLGVLPLRDGSTAVSLVVSHYLLDGLGLSLAVADAATGTTRDLSYPPPCSRTRLRAVVEDSRQTVRDAPQVARAVVAAARLGRKQAGRRRNRAKSPASRPVVIGGRPGDDVIVVPAITISMDQDEWEARATALGGTSSTLAAGFASKLAEQMGRRRASDGAVSVHLPISQRADGDTRAIAVSFACVSVDPTRVTTDLRDVRVAVEQALTTLRQTPEKSSQFLWLTLFMRKRALKRLIDTALTGADVPVFCSHAGDFGSAVCRLDGTDAEYVTARGIRQHVTRQWLERTGGLMQLHFLAPSRQELDQSRGLPTGRREHKVRFM